MTPREWAQIATVLATLVAIASLTVQLTALRRRLVLGHLVQGRDDVLRVDQRCRAA